MKIKRNDRVRVIENIDTFDPQYGIRGLAGVVCDVNQDEAQILFRHGYNTVKLERLIKLNKRK